jgi:hypothetical protein
MFKCSWFFLYFNIQTTRYEEHSVKTGYFPIESCNEGTGCTLMNVCSFHWELIKMKASWNIASCSLVDVDGHFTGVLCQKADIFIVTSVRRDLTEINSRFILDKVMNASEVYSAIHVILIISYLTVIFQQHTF